MPLRIAIIAHVRHAIAEPFAGGLEAHTASLANGLAGLGHRVTLFGAAGAQACACAEPFCRPTGNLTDADFAYEHSSYQALMFRLAESSFDIVHNNSLHYLTVGMAGLLRVPMVTTLHTPPFWEITGAMRLSANRNVRYVAVSDSVRRLWASDAPAVTIANGIDLARFAYRGTPEATPYLIWSGRIVPEKGLHLAIAAARLTPFALLIAGPIADAGYFEAQIRPLLTGQVRYLGHLGQGELIAHIAGAAACLCTPIWDEPYGLVVAEALACGTPVAAFARGALPALLDAGSGVLAAPDDVVGLARAAIAATGLSRACARARAQAIGDGAGMIRAYAALYETCLSASPAETCAPPAGLEDVTSRQALRALYAAPRRDAA
jgi:glycosyltransferase involved in cell wall biosynthesis